MYKTLCWVLLAVFAIGIPLRAAEPTIQKELVPTPGGNFYIWHRTPAAEADLGMPIVTGATVQQSFVYRVRDRKLRDLQFLARVQLTSPQPADELRQWYLATLGNGAAQETDAKNGEITIVVGEKDDFRMVVITPQPQGCQLRLEHVQQFTIPARVFTAQEQPVVNLLGEVADNYHAARRVSYTMQQEVVLPPEAGEEQPGTLNWSVDFQRPARLTVTAQVEKIVALKITTAKQALQVETQTGKPEIRPIADEITLDDVPELNEDPAVGLIFGESLIDDQLDDLTMRDIKDRQGKRQVEVTLVYTDQHETLRLLIDPQNKTVLRCETSITDEGETTKVIRTYTKMTLERRQR